MEEILLEHGRLLIALLILIVPALSIMLRMWWKVEMRQDNAIGELHRTNDEAHGKLYGEVHKTRQMMTDQHGQLRDKIEKIWQHLVTHGDDSSRSSKRD